MAYGSDDFEGLHGPQVSFCTVFQILHNKRIIHSTHCEKVTETGILTEISKESRNLILACNKMEQSTVSFQSQSEKNCKLGQ